MASFYVHSIMMENSALAGEGGGCTPTPSILFTITYKVAVYAPAERADTLPVYSVATPLTFPTELAF